MKEKSSAHLLEPEALQLEAVIQSAPIVLWALDRNGNYTLSVGQGLEHLGLGQNELLGRNHFALYEQSAPDAVRTAKRALAGETFTEVVAIRGRWYVTHYAPECAENGEIIGMAAVSADITEQKTSENRIKHSQATLEQIFQSSPAFMNLIVGPDHLYELANQRFYEFTGLDPSILGKKALSWMPEVDQAAFLALIEQVYRTGKAVSGTDIPVRRASPDGQFALRYIDYVYQPVRDSEGAIYGVVSQGFDVTEKVLARKNAELTKRAIENERNNFRNLFKQTPEMVCILRGPTHVFEFTNEAHIRVLGFNATGRNVREAQPESVEVHGILDAVYRTGVTAELHEIPVTVTGRRRYFNLTYSAARTEEGSINGIMILGVEVTDQIEAREQLKQAVFSRDEFLSIASHELKTPLTTLKMQLQMTRRGLNPELGVSPPLAKLAQVLDSSNLQVDRLTRLIDDLLDVSRISAGKMSYNFEPVDPPRLIAETAERFADQIREAGSTLELSVMPALEVEGDHFRIEQVIANLLTNAIKYAGQGKLRVSLSLAAEGAAEIRVRDDGIGIAADKLPRIFERFERAVSHQNISGLGLGLYICKQIVDAHGGDISVESRLGEGAIFTVRLPAAQPSHRS